MSLQLLNRLLGSASGAGTAVLCTCSKNGEMDVMTSLEPLVREDRITVVRLEPFTEEETEEILRRELPDVAKEAGKCRSIYKTTEGNAFFLREMINLIRKKGFTLEKSAKTNLAIQTQMCIRDSLQADGDLKKLLLPPGNGFFSEPLERYFTGAAPDPGKRRPGIFKDRG